MTTNGPMLVFDLVRPQPDSGSEPRRPAGLLAVMAAERAVVSLRRRFSVPKRRLGHAAPGGSTPPERRFPPFELLDPRLTARRKPILTLAAMKRLGALMLVLCGAGLSGLLAGAGAVTRPRGSTLTVAGPTQVIGIPAPRYVLTATIANSGSVAATGVTISSTFSAGDAREEIDGRPELRRHRA